mmetsp:Transcript_26620/g.38155  ORF Transcript_26620/g.38155 Transcript_26620/m.38155 type:complete len:392 (-) Transcript_26620:40-1215(-)
MSHSNPALVDPILDYLELKNAGDLNISPVVLSPQMGHPSLWRQAPGDSFSDWKIILVADEDDATTNSIQDISTDCKKLNDDEQTIRNGNGRYDSTTMATFHVHKFILANASYYFHSQFSQHQETIEKTTSTSTIQLHRNAFQAFPVFLDYLYNSQIGRMSFSQENAVALRHLAMYFGVDVLLNDITGLIIADLNRRKSRVIFQEHANVFNDEKLMEALKTFKERQNILLPIAESTSKNLLENVEKYLTRDTYDILKNWLYISRYMDSDFQDAFFAAKNAEKFPVFFVSGAGLTKANGHYKLIGIYSDDATTLSYSNGVCKVNRFSDDPYDEDNSDYFWEFYLDNYLQDMGIELYSNYSTSDQPPTTGWKARESPYDPAPTCITSLNSNLCL